MLASAANMTAIVPGHVGPASNKSELEGHRNMLLAIREKIVGFKKQGRSLEEGIAVKPSAAFDPA